MDKKFIEEWLRAKEDIRKTLSESHVTNYYDLVQKVLKAIGGGEDTSFPLDHRGLKVLKGGCSYSGENIYVFQDKSYYGAWYYVRVVYGSCSTCDSLLYIKEDLAGEDPRKVNAKQLRAYMLMALHIVENIKEFEGKGVDIPDEEEIAAEYKRLKGELL